VLDREGVERTHVVGSSLGGYLAQYVVAVQPGRVERAVLGNTFPPNDVIARKYRIVGKILPFLPEPLVMHMMGKNIREEVYPASGRDDLTLAYLLEQCRGRMGKAHLIRRLQCVVEPFVPADPERLGIPVAVVESDNDPLVDEALRERLKRTYPSAVVHTLHGAGHFPYLSRPGEYTELLEGFFQAVPKPS
jgi:pimeloyl-ACP methyl ester carboxylesterase